MERQGNRRTVRMVIAAGAVIGIVTGLLYAGIRDWSTDDDTGTGTDSHAAMSSPGQERGELAQALAKARRATLKYATDLRTAQADGYKVITPMMADMGVHYLNPDVKGFDVERPPILVYVGTADAVQLAALEWVFPETPGSPPLPGATYGTFDAACHYSDGEFVVGDESSCGPTHPRTHAPFFFWHPRLVTLHVWLWYPNPDGIYHPTNPFITPYS